MQRSRHRRRRGRATRVTLASLKGAALGGLLTLVVVNGTGNPSATPGPSASTPSAYQRVVERAMAENNCSYQGFGADVIPASALIRTTSGAVRQVSFDVGWDVYNGRRPGTLIAVCLDEGPRTSLVSR